MRRAKGFNLRRGRVKSKTDGFTLIELLISLAISAIILLVIIGTTNIVLQRTKGGFESFEAQKDALGVMNNVAQEVRQATQIINAGTQSITFRKYLTVDATAPHQIRFFLDSETVKRGEIPPTGSGPNYTYDPANETIKILAADVINGSDPIFSYFNQDGSQLSAPITLAEVTLVDINFVFRQLLNPNPLRVSTKAQLRFNKNNL